MKLLHSLASVLPILVTAVGVSAQQTELAPVVAQSVERTVRLPAEFGAYQRVAIYARVASFVEQVHVDRGSVVKRGQPLVSLTAPELAAQVAESEAKAQAVMLQLAEAEAKLVAARTNAEMLRAASKTSGAVSNAELVVAEQTLQASQAVKNAVENSAKAARSASDAVRELAGYLQVRAPFDGIITERLVHPGALVGPATAGVSAPLVQLEQSSRLRLLVAVPEAHVAGVINGAKVAFTVPAYPELSFAGTIARIGRALDTRTRSMIVELDVTNTDGKLATGMYADVVWPVRRPSTSLLVPATSVVTTTERTFVIRNRGGKAEWVNVRRGAIVGQSVEVYGDLRPGDMVVRRATDEIRDGSALRGGRSGN
jgi:membrane fusion protein, multidrug efflux system